ncbi:MAG: tachylectin-related carbohydrate-binding protein [Myxococcota bacterium]
MMFGAWVFALSARAQDDGAIGQVSEGLAAPATLVPVETQQQLGLVNVSGDCSGTLINRYWVLTAHHCVSVGNLLGAASDLPSNIPVTAHWSRAVVHPTRIVTWSPNLDVALLYLGEGDFGPAPSQPFYVQEVTTDDTVRKYGQGRSTFAVPPNTPAVSDHAYRTSDFVPSSASSTSYTVTFAPGAAVAHGGDSGGPAVVISGTVPMGIAAVQSTCLASAYVAGMPKNWDWATGISSCSDAALYTIRDEILAAAAEVPADRDLDPDPLPNLSLTVGAPNPTPSWLYNVTAAGTLMWNHQDGATPGWDGPSMVGTGWSGFLDVVPVGGDHLFAVGGDGTLYGYRHDGYLYGSGEWTGGTPLRYDWAYPVTIGGGDGVVYAIDYDGTLVWYRCSDLDHAEDPATWTGPSVVGWGWGQFAKVVSTGNGTLYAMLPNGDLWVYHHDGFWSGASAWSDIRKVGTGWQMFEHLVGLDNDALIGVMPDGTVWWYHHLGRSSGSGQSFQHEVWEGPLQLGGGWAGMTDVFALLGAD